MTFKWISMDVYKTWIITNYVEWLTTLDPVENNWRCKLVILLGAVGDTKQWSCSEKLGVAKLWSCWEKNWELQNCTRCCEQWSSKIVTLLGAVGEMLVRVWSNWEFETWWSCREWLEFQTLWSCWERMVGVSKLRNPVGNNSWEFWHIVIPLDVVEV